VGSTTPAKVRDIKSEAGVRHLNMTPALILVLVVVMAARFLSFL